MKKQSAFATASYLLLTFLFSLAPFSLWAQAPGREPYSTSDFEEYKDQVWYESPLLYIGLILFFGLILYFLRQRHYRSRHRFMKPGRDTDA